ncbi:MAG TPA: adenine deaminase, partial [Phycisphaerales bacterium]|nr:adenine deaminase [Phycisphaerales bacterium]
MTDTTTTPTSVANGDEPADILLQGGRVIDVESRSVDKIDIGIVGDRIVLGAVDGKKIIDLEDAYVSPGFIDAHMHVESTMLPPSSFANLAVPHGTTSVILDPHEIANVLGIGGIKLLMDDAVG